MEHVEQEDRRGKLGREQPEHLRAAADAQPNDSAVHRLLLEALRRVVLDPRLTFEARQLPRHRLSSLKAWVQLLDWKPGMHHKMQSGSMARAASTPPMSSVSQPKRSRTSRASALAPASLPQMNIDGLPPGKLGLTIDGLPTDEKHF